MNDNAHWAEDQDDDFYLRGLLLKFLRYWYWFAIAGALGLFVTYQYLKLVTPMYRVGATLLIKDELPRGARAGGDIVEQLDMSGKKNLENEMAIIRSRPLIEKVVEKLGLTVTYWQEGVNRDTEIYKQSPIKIYLSEFSSGEPFFIQPLGGNKYNILDQDKNKIKTFEYTQKVNSQYGKFRVFKRDSTLKSEMNLVKVTLESKEAVVEQIIGNLQVSYPGQRSTLLSLTIATPLPEKGKDVLKAVLDEYTFTTLEDKNREASNTLRFIEERLMLVTQELGDVEQDVEQYRRSKRITDLSTEASLFLDRVQDNDAKLNEIEINLQVLEGVDSYVNSNQLGNFAPATLGVNDPVLTSYIDRLSELEADRTKLAQTVTAMNPSLVSLNSQMRNVKQAIQENLKNQRTNLLVSKNSLIALNNRLQGTISTIPRKEREFLEIKRQAGVKENLYLLLLEKREETALSYASTVTDSRVIDPPFTQGSIGPQSWNIYFYALVIAFLLTTTLIFIQDTLNNTVQSKKEIEKKTGIKIFGELGKIPEQQTGQIIDLSGRSFLSEQLRMLRSNMQYLFPNSNLELGKTILVTSSTGLEGKSFVTLNLAQSLALLDKKVIILGLDLRKPKVDQYMLADNKLGISTYLIGQADESTIVQKTKFKNLFIVPSGPIPPNPSELISTDRMKTLIEDLKGKYDYIIMDTPPTGLVTDAILLAPFADAVIYIVRYNMTPKPFLNTISDFLRNKQFNSLNIIFNGVDYKKSSEYGYGYEYAYGKGGYYADSQYKGWFNRKLRWIKNRFF